MQFNKVSYPN